MVSAAAPQKPNPGHHQGSPHRIATKCPQTARIQDGHCLDIIPKGRPDTGAQASPSATPQTPEPPEREREREAVGGIRCCGNVLKRGKRQAKGAEAPKRQSHTPDPRTACTHDHSENEMVNGMRCCGSVPGCRQDERQSSRQRNHFSGRSASRQASVHQHARQVVVTAAHSATHVAVGIT